MRKKVLLMILDGWGEGDKSESDLIFQAKTDFMKGLYKNPAWKYSQILTCGEHVGLPDGQMGNSEVGHLNLGAGRIVYQDFVKINRAVEDNSISQNQTLAEAFIYAKKNNKSVHFIGLVSDGGVHSSTEHLKKLCQISTQHHIEKSFIHILTDGRDTDPHSGIKYVSDLDEFLKTTNTKIASVCGRYYTMDRDKRWERVRKGYDLMVRGIGHKFKSAAEAINESYKNNITDEFIEPSLIIDENNKPVATIKENDVVICFNFRTDRLREITTVLTQKDIPDYDMHKMSLHYLTMTRYDDSFKNVEIIFDKENVRPTLGEILSKNNLKQIRIAETEKYPHVTFFFSGGREEEFEGERRILIPSPKVATYDLKPSMSAVEVKDAIIPEIISRETDFICLNFANGDMVGHTAVKNAIIEAVETVDTCVREIAETAINNGYSIIITSDHGNSDFSINEDGSPNTAHSLNPVPLFLYDKDIKSIKSQGILANIAPTILRIMNIPVPEEMIESLLD